MANLTIVAPGGFAYFPIFGNFSSGSNFFAGFTGFSNKTATGLKANSGSSSLEAAGNGIAYDTDGNIVDGTITSLTYKVGAQTIFTYTGLAFDAGAFQTAIERAAGNNDALFRAMFISPDMNLVGSASSVDVRTGNGDDSINLGGDGDYLELAGGTDTIDGGGGEDYISYRWYAGIRGIAVDLEAGTIIDQFGDTDTFRNVEIIEGTVLNDRFLGSGDDDYIRSADEGRDRYNGRGGSDYLDYFDNPGGLGIIVNLSGGFIIDPFGFRDIVTNIEEIGATVRNDSILGSSDDNWFDPHDGTDTLNGGAGFDAVSYLGDEEGGAAGIVANLATGKITDAYGKTDTVSNIEGVSGTIFGDSITGNSKDNEFYGWEGADTYGGGAGFDRVIYSEEDGGSGIVVNLDSGVGKDTFGSKESFSSIEEVEGSQYADSITGNSQDNWFLGFEGKDTIRGGAGVDVIDYSDEVFFGGGAGVAVDLGSGTATDGFGDTDSLFTIENVAGTRFNDTIIGSSGANVLAGGGGNDTLTGGGGADAFMIVEAALGAGNVDTFTDFIVADDTILLDLGLFSALAEGAIAANQFRKAAGGTPVATTANHHIIYSTSSGAVFYDADGAGGAAQVRIAVLTGSPDDVTHEDFAGFV